MPLRQISEPQRKEGLRRAEEKDAQTVDELYLNSRKHFLPYAPVAHSFGDGSGNEEGLTDVL